MEDSNSIINNQHEKDDELMKIFCNTETYHGTIDNDSIVYKVTYCNDHLHFLLYDYEAIYYSKQSNNDISSLNKSLNSSLEFSELHSLVTFIIDNLLKLDDKLTINKELCNDITMISFEAVINIINVKWIVNCKKNIKCHQISQNLFIKPLNNIILSFGYLINSENEVISVGKGKNVNAININDAVTLINNAYVNKNRGFSKMMNQLTKESTRKVNEGKYGQDKGKDKVKINDQKVLNTKKENSRINQSKVKTANQFIESKEPIIDEDISELENINKKVSKKKKKMKFI